MATDRNKQHRPNPRPRPTEELLGTPFFRAMLAEAPAMEQDFEQFKQEFANLRQLDHEFIGRFVRCHLLVEHFLTEYLRAAYPQMPGLAELRLNFDSKLKLANNPDVSVSVFEPAIKCLNQIRNKLVHRIEFRPSHTYLSPIRQVVTVWAGAAGKPVRDGIELIEDFTDLVCMNLRAATGMMRRHAAEDGLVGYIRWYRNAWNAGDAGQAQ